MRTATTIEASGFDEWSQLTDFVVEADKLGLDICWVVEAWGSDAPSALGYYAARTERMLLGSGIMQLGTRTPVAVAQTAITLSNLSEGRFLLGLGASGPQVIEGLRGVAFARPLARMRETVEIVRRVLEGGKISYFGGEFQIPRPGGDAVPMRLSMRAHHPISIYLATLSPAMLRLTGEVADGWLGTSFVPEGAADAYFRYLDEGLAVVVVPGRSWMSARAPRSPSRPTKMPCARWWPGGRRSWPSASAVWVRRRRTSTTRPTAGRGGPRSPPRCANAGRPATVTGRPSSSLTRWCSAQR